MGEICNRVGIAADTDNGNCKSGSSESACTVGTYIGAGDQSGTSPRGSAVSFVHCGTLTKHRGIRNTAVSNLDDLISQVQGTERWKVLLD